MSSSPTGSWFGTYTPRTGGPSPRHLAETFENDLSEIARTRFPRAFEPMVVPRESYRELMRATERVLELQRRAVIALAPDSEGRVAALKADPADLPRLGSDEAYEAAHAIDFSRADVVVAEDGPKFVEFNVGAGVGAMLEFELERRIWQQVRRETGEPELTAPSLYGLIAGHVERTCAALGIPPAVLLVGCLADPAKTTRYFDTQIGLLREQGVQARFADLRTLLDEMGSTAGTAGLLGIVQFAEREANNCGWDMSPLVTATRNGLFALPSQTARLVDSKKVLALLSEGLPWMSGEDHDVVRRHVPWTRIVADRKADWRGRSHELPVLLVEQQEHFVLKGASGYSSQEVFFGLSTPAADWERLVASAVESEYYVAQEVVMPVRHPMRALLDEDGNTDTVMANPRVSPFCVAGVATGCSMRFNPTDQIGPVTRPYGAWPGVLLGAP
ncbi:hypothetical protein [Streptomyces spongiae]|uniref:Circularly permuted type 2 ATP-grasp protein n=1 Tax=Streptomyces spongiae TaxID=565072 RepID=A0A5N8XRF0_9ACTN|nr:hypothetical protein [Streptomyces spongiae]MPY61990.1 hypothetical protein [Streptomyces spongiae]